MSIFDKGLNREVCVLVLLFLFSPLSVFAKKVYTSAQLQNSYRLLGVDAGSDMELVQQAKKRLMVKLQAEINAGSKAAEERFKLVSEAFYTIKEISEGTAVLAGGVRPKPASPSPAPKPQAKEAPRETWISKFTREMDSTSPARLNQLRSKYLANVRTASEFLVVAGYDTRNPKLQEAFLQEHFGYFRSLKPNAEETARLIPFTSNSRMQDRLLQLIDLNGKKTSDLLAILEAMNLRNWQTRDLLAFQQFVGKLLDRSNSQSDFLRAVKLLGSGRNPDSLRIADEHMETFARLAVNPETEPSFQSWLAEKDAPIFVRIVRDRLKQLRVQFLRDMESCAKAYQYVR